MNNRRFINKPTAFVVLSAIVSIFIMALPGWSSAAESCASSGHLFYIASNCNQNVVYYDVCLDPGNKIAADNPVKMYWVSNSGRSYELNFVERLLAYGLRSVINKGQNGMGFTVAALKNTAISLTMIDGRYSAVINLGKGEMVIDRVYVNATSNFLGLPRVNWVDITGRTRSGNAPVTERLTPDKV